MTHRFNLIGGVDTSPIQKAVDKQLILLIEAMPANGVGSVTIDPATAQQG